MRYVRRGTDGKVRGSFAVLQPGYAEEPLADDHADLLEFQNRKPPERPDPLREALIKKGVVTKAEIDAESPKVSADTEIRG